MIIGLYIKGGTTPIRLRLKTQTTTEEIFARTFRHILKTVNKCSFMSFLGTNLPSKENEVHVLETLASLATSKVVLAPVLTELWAGAEKLLADGSLERCHCYLSTIAKVRIIPGWRSLVYLFERWR